MPTIRVKQSIAANDSGYPLQGNQYEYLPFNARLEFAIIAAAAGVEATVYSGSDVLQQQGPTTVKTTPVSYPDDFVLEDVALAGERLNVILNNTTAAAIDVETVVKITPL